ITGRVDAAASAYELALKLDSNLSEAMFNLADTRPSHLDSDLRKRISRFTQDPRRTSTDLANACFALARIAETAGEITEAFAHYQRGNIAAAAAMRERGVIYDKAATEQRAAEIIRRFSGALRIPASPPISAFRPVFIVGMPRSGTTVVEQILACHSEVAAGGEQPHLSPCAPLVARFLSMRDLPPAPHQLDALCGRPRPLLLHQRLDRVLRRPPLTRH